MRIALRFSNRTPAETIRGLAALLEALTRIDADQLGAVPSLYDSGVRYKGECRRGRGGQVCDETWTDAIETYELRHGDCEDLAAWRAAELRRSNVPALALPLFVTPRLVHCLVWTPGGIDDPSVRLGMAPLPAGVDPAPSIARSLEVLA